MCMRDAEGAAPYIFGRAWKPAPTELCNTTYTQKEAIMVIKKHHIALVLAALLLLIAMREFPQVYMIIVLWFAVNYGCSIELKKQWENNNPNGFFLFAVGISWVIWAIFTAVAASFAIDLTSYFEKVREEFTTAAYMD